VVPRYTSDGAEQVPLCSLGFRVVTLDKRGTRWTGKLDSVHTTRVKTDYTVAPIDRLGIARAFDLIELLMSRADITS